MPIVTLLVADSTLRRRIQHAATGQQLVLSRRQLAECGATWDLVQGQLRAERWQQVGPHVLVLHNGPLTRQQQLWCAVLHVGPKGCLVAGTALEVHGFVGLGTPDAETVHVGHPRATSVPSLPWLEVHESRRLRPDDIIRRRGLPVTDCARAAIDRAAWQPYRRFTYALVAAVVQQRLTNTASLSRALVRAGRVRHARDLRLAIADAAGGAQALGEIDLGRLCRRHRLVPPHRQRIRTDASGRRRYLDAEWQLADGSLVVLEVDGSHHMWVAHWTDDMKRERRVVLGARRSTVLRCSAVEVRVDDPDLIHDLVDAGVPRKQ